jgi:acyl phosphate:glycerol-3-phosphate acyltransferase
VIEIILKGALSYLLGSVIGGLVIGRLKGGVDIRKSGSGNAGGTNALRTQGAGFAFWVMLIDIGKGCCATAVLAPAPVSGLLPRLLPGVVQTPLHAWCVAVCGIAVLVGHVYPLWYGFRGGKGVATLLGAAAGIAPWLLLPMLLTWLLAAVLFGYVGLASMLAACALGVAIAVSALTPRVPLVSFGIVSAALIAFTHRANIGRMRAGCEPRAMRLWLLGAGGGGDLT